MHRLQLHAQQTAARFLALCAQLNCWPLSLLLHIRAHQSHTHTVQMCDHVGRQGSEGLACCVQMSMRCALDLRLLASHLALAQAAGKQASRCMLLLVSGARCSCSTCAASAPGNVALTHNRGHFVSPMLCGCWGRGVLVWARPGFWFGPVPTDSRVNCLPGTSSPYTHMPRESKDALPLPSKVFPVSKATCFNSREEACSGLPPVQKRECFAFLKKLDRGHLAVPGLKAAVSGPSNCCCNQHSSCKAIRLLLHCARAKRQCILQARCCCGHCRFSVKVCLSRL